MTALPPDVVADLRRENARLQAELRAARDRQNASADILRAIASAPGDAERALHQIAETTMRLFGAPSATIQIAEGDGWSQVIRVGDSSKRIGAGVPEAQLRIGGRNMPGTIVAENRQVHIPDVDNVDPAIADWPGLPSCPRRRHPVDVRLAAAARGQGDRATHRLSRPARALHRRGARASAKFCRSGRDRDRECAAVQRDQGGAGAADRHRGHPESHRRFAIGRAAGVRSDRQERGEVVRALLRDDHNSERR